MTKLSAYLVSVAACTIDGAMTGFALSTNLGSGLHMGGAMVGGALAGFTNGLLAGLVIVGFLLARDRMTRLNKEKREIVHSAKP